MGRPAPGGRRRRSRRLSVALAVLVGALLAGLLLAEGVVRLFSFDWRFLEKTLYYNGVDVDSFRADPDPVLLYRPRSNSSARYWSQYGEYAVSVNSLGFRGPERTVEKPPGVFRIFCLGGSNVWGAEVNDRETWPAQLEARLNADSPGRYEVWNLGACGYVAMQMATLAREFTERCDPDLVIFGLSNLGHRPFLMGAPVRPHFDAHPQLWRELFPARDLEPSRWLPGETRFRLVRRSRLARLLLAADVVLRREERLWPVEPQQEMNYRYVREFFRYLRSRARAFIFIWPTETPEAFDVFFEGLDAAVCTLSPEGGPSEYHDIHPPAYVFTWYAEELARWMREGGFLPGDGAAASLPVDDVQ